MSSDSGDKKIPKIVIPKLVLKLSPQVGQSESNHGDELRKNSLKKTVEELKSSEAAEYVQNNWNILRPQGVSFHYLMKKVNQSNYRDLENIMELLGRMNDVERRRNLIQVLLKIRDNLKQVYLVNEWSKIYNEYYATKFLLEDALQRGRELTRAADTLAHDCNRKLAEKSVASVNPSHIVEILNPNLNQKSYYPKSIMNMAEKLFSPGVDETKTKIYTQTLNNLLWTKLSIGLMLVDKKDVQVLSVELGLAKLHVLQSFTLSLTLAPDLVESGKSFWYITDVSVSCDDQNTAKSFGSSLRAIFQDRQINKSSDNREYFKSLVHDLKMYVHMYFFEALYSQFVALNRKYTKSAISIVKESGSFEVKLWGDKARIMVKMNMDKGFEIQSDCEINIMPSLIITGDEATEICKKAIEIWVEHKSAEMSEFLEIKSSLRAVKTTAKSSIISMKLSELLTLTVLFDVFAAKCRIYVGNQIVNDKLLDGIARAFENFEFDKIEELLIELKKLSYFDSLKQHLSLSLKNFCRVPAETSLLGFSDDSLVAVLCADTNACIQFKIFDDFTMELDLVIFKSVYSNGVVRLEVADKIHLTSSSQDSFEAGKFDDLLESVKFRISSQLEISKGQQQLRAVGLQGKFTDDNCFIVTNIPLASCVNEVKIITGDVNVYRGYLNVNSSYISAWIKDFHLTETDRCKIENDKLSTASFKDLNLLATFLRSLCRIIEVLMYWPQTTTKMKFVSATTERILLCRDEVYFEIRMNERFNLTVKCEAVPQMETLSDYFNSKQFSIYKLVEKLDKIFDNAKSGSPPSSSQNVQSSWLTEI